MDIKLVVNNIYDDLVAIRRDFHMHPELSENEFRTMNKVCEYLDKWNIEYKKGVAGTGVVAIVRGKNSGKTIGLRADMDALPVVEQTNMPYKSLNDGIMHACGHDAHMTILLGAARILKSMENELNGNVKFFFQPAEETVGGADRMIKEGCLKSPNVDYALGIHVSPNIELGKIELRYGKMNASCDDITIIIRGKSAHGADPQKSVDPIIISGNIISALQSIVSRNISPLNSAVFTIGSIHGGIRGNIIPDEVKMECTLRTLDNDTRKFIKERIVTIVKNISAGFGGEGIVIINESYAPLINDDSTVKVVRDTAEKILGKDNILFIPQAELFAEDFSYFTQEVKSCFYHVGCANKSKGIIHPLHNSKFDIDEECLKIGVALQVANTLALLNY